MPGWFPNVVLEVDTIETAKRMVERGLGVSFLPQMAVLQELRSGKLTTVPLTDAELLGRSLDLVPPRHRPLRAEVQAFLGVIREAAGDAPSVRRTSSRLSRRARR